MFVSVLVLDVDCVKLVGSGVSDIYHARLSITIDSALDLASRDHDVTSEIIHVIEEHLVSLERSI